MSKNIKGIDCSKIKHGNIIKVIRNFMNNISTNYPRDYSKILQRVKFIKPVPKKDLKSGAIGEWVKWKNTVNVSTKEKDLEMVLFLISHEFGHVCTTKNDLSRRGGPLEEWAHEAAADWYVCKWGYRYLYKKFRKDLKMGHHGAMAGETITIGIGSGSQEYYLTKNFVYKTVSRKFNEHLIDLPPKKSTVC